jgi:hypothetical protein
VTLHLEFRTVRRSVEDDASPVELHGKFGILARFWGIDVATVLNENFAERDDRPRFTHGSSPEAL